MHRIEDDRLLRGASRYVEDLAAPGCLHAVFVRSPHAHARIDGIDTRAARRIVGAGAVFTGRDFLAFGVRPMVCSRPLESSDGTPFQAPVRHVLAVDRDRKSVV